MDRDAVVDRIRRVAAEFDGIVSVYLFGSYAVGREHAESDVDVGVLLDRTRYPEEDQRFDQRLVLSSALSTPRGLQADVVILNDAPATLGRAIVTNGVRLICTDDEKDRAFVRDVQLRAPDLDLFLRRMRAVKLEGLGER